MWTTSRLFIIILFLGLFIFLPAPGSIPNEDPDRIPLTRQESAFLKKHPRILIGAEKEWEPSIILRKDGSIVGYDADILKLVNKKTGANFTLLPGNWQQMVEKARNREIDGLSSGAALDGRRAYLNFSDVYNHLLRMVLVLKGNPLEIRTWEDLKNKRIVIQQGNQFDEKTVKSLPQAIIVRADTVEALLGTLISGKADAAFGQGAYMYLAGKLGISTLQYAFAMEDNLELVFSLRNDWPEALSIMNKGLRAIPKDEYDRIYTKWYGALPESHFNFLLFLKITLPLALAAATLLAVYFRKMSRQLLNAQTELKKDITRRRLAQEKLDWELRINKALAELANTLISPAQSIDEIASRVLSSAQAVTRSKHGFVSEIDRSTHENKAYTLTDMFGTSCRVPESDRRISFPRDEDGTYGKLWGHALNTGEPFFTNSPGTHPRSKGVPEGHVPLDRFLSVPVKYSGEVIGQIGLANPPFDYSHRHVEAVRQLADLYAMAIQRKRSQEDSRRIESQLRQAQKMEALGTLAGGIAHDFNNILSAIIGYSELVLGDIEQGEVSPQSIKEILKAGERARDLVTQILTFSRKMEPDLSPMDMNLVINQTMKMLARTFPRMISIELRLADDLRLINGDSGQMSQLVMNLCANAHDAMPDGGRLVIETQNIKLDEAYAGQHPGTVPGDYLRLTVSDTGSGMDRETRDHIFDPFYTSKEVGKGTGLGLSTVYGIIKAHGGRIICHSEPGQGTTFRVYLPVITSPGSEETERESQAAAIQGGRETILLVDDDPQIRNLGKKMLTRKGYRVMVARSGEEAIDVYRDYKRDIHLIILDISMPGMGGRRCLRALLGLNPRLKVIISSGYSLNGQLKLIDGAAGFVPKPFSSLEMLTKVREILDR